MHWLAEELQRLRALASTHAVLKDRSAGVSRIDDDESAARAAFMRALDDLVERIAQKSGIAACFVAHDGLLAACRGNAPDFEALAALAQTCVASAEKAASALTLGPLSQIVVVGAEHKLAVITIGPIVVGIVCPTDVPLQQLLAA